MKRTDQSVAQFRRAIELRAQLVEAEPGVAEYVAELGQSYMDLGVVLNRGGRFAEVGTVGQLRPCAKTIDLKGATVIPGVIDSHVHFTRCGLNPGHEVRIIESATSIAELP